MQKPSFSPFCAKNAPFVAISITISVRYNPTDRKNRPFGLLWFVKFEISLLVNV